MDGDATSAAQRRPARHRRARAVGRRQRPVGSQGSTPRDPAHPAARHSSRGRARSTAAAASPPTTQIASTPNCPDGSTSRASPASKSRSGSRGAPEPSGTSRAWPPPARRSATTPSSTSTPTAAYQRKQAIRVMHAAADLDVRWFEEPVSSDDLTGLAQVRDAVRPDVAAGEYGWDLAYLNRMAPYVDCLQIDVTRCGGITEFQRAAAVAAAHDLEVSGHCAAAPAPRGRRGHAQPAPPGMVPRPRPHRTPPVRRRQRRDRRHPHTRPAGPGQWIDVPTRRRWTMAHRLTRAARPMTGVNRRPSWPTTTSAPTRGRVQPRPHGQPTRLPPTPTGPRNRAPPAINRPQGVSSHVHNRQSCHDEGGRTGCGASCRADIMDEFSHATAAP